MGGKQGTVRYFGKFIKSSVEFSNFSIQNVAITIRNHAILAILARTRNIKHALSAGENIADLSSFLLISFSTSWWTIW